MHFTSSIVATLGMASYANAHIKMTTPKPFGASSLTNDPLLGDGSDFPCKQSGGIYDAEGASNTMALGSTQPLNFVGSAVHGGGSCQISVTYDEKPVKDSVWKVIHSIEGGCPAQGVEGNLGGGPDTPVPDDYSFSIPDSLPTGKAVLAWTWFNKVGNREMYMNCAPIDITGRNSKSKRETAAYDALPDMFIANIDNGCGTKEGVDLQFPSPGNFVDKFGSGSLRGPVGNCQAGSGSTGGSGSSEAHFSTQGSSSASSACTVLPSATAAPVETAAPVVTDVDVLANNTIAGSSETAAGSPCPDQEGTWNCISGTTFQRCASGEWSVVQSVAEGTTCEAGISQNIKFVNVAKPKRAVGFLNEHIRRHVPYKREVHLNAATAATKPS
ncbi:hypothetical protein VE03_06281 [Pseudogymnoascus sp. 23342-1-I1]|nr:hypothetical protein VE03_06281 [Pseudogymnoascus sp. 23342-1-I1]